MLIAPKDANQIRDIIFQKRDGLSSSLINEPFKGGQSITKQPQGTASMDNLALQELREIKTSVARIENLMASKK